MDKRVIKKGMEALVMIDEDVANAVEQVGYPAPRLRPVGFETLFAAILSQQISTDAARAIRERVIALMHDVSAKSLLGLRGFVWMKSSNKLMHYPAIVVDSPIL
jgi:DNA-3-methyladenine glycosylase II